MQSALSKPMAEVARELGIHPFQLVAALSRLCEAFEDAYPVVQDDLIKSASVLLKRFDGHAESDCDCEEAGHSSTVEYSTHEVSEDGIKILRALTKKKYWGGNAVSSDTVRLHFCRDVDDWATAERELIRRGLILRQKGSAISLNVKQKAQIEKLTAHS